MELGTVQFQRRVSRADASRQLGVDLRAIARMIESGDLKTVSLPGRVRNIILQSSVDDLVAKMTAATRTSS